MTDVTLKGLGLALQTKELAKFGVNATPEAATTGGFSQNFKFAETAEFPKSTGLRLRFQVKKTHGGCDQVVVSLSLIHI